MLETTQRHSSAGELMAAATPQPTPAYREAIDGAAPRATPGRAFALARDRFLRGERVDMQALADELGISRTTLYRWTGDRERLLADVEFSLWSAALDLAAEEPGSETSLSALFRRHMQIISEHPALRQFVQGEPEFALRVLTSPRAGLRARATRRVREILESAVDDGRLRTNADLDVLAFAIIRVTEAFLYNDTVTDLNPNIDGAGAIFAILLGDDR